MLACWLSKCGFNLYFWQINCNVNISRSYPVQCCIWSAWSGNVIAVWTVPWGSGSENLSPCFSNQLIHVEPHWGAMGLCSVSVSIDWFLWTKLGDYGKFCCVARLKPTGILVHENVDSTKWGDWCCPVKVPSLAVPTQSLLNNQFPIVFIGQEICIVLQAEPSGLPRPPVVCDENLIGKPEMLLSHAVGQWARNLMMISRG